MVLSLHRQSAWSIDVQQHEQVKVDGWLDHDGSGLPIPYSAFVQVQFRGDRDTRAAERACGGVSLPAYSYGGWEHDGGDADVVRFRLAA